MAESICNLKTSNPVLVMAKLKNQTSCCCSEMDQNMEKPSVFSPEGLEDAQKYVDKNYPGSKAIPSKSKLDSFFNLYDVKSPPKNNF